jgi:molecular chaperone DnaK (HSP70)
LAGGKIVDIVRLNRSCDENPAIGKRIRALAEKNKIRAIGRSVTAIKRSIIRFSNDITDEIKAAMPRHLPRDLRDDATQNIRVVLCVMCRLHFTKERRLTISLDFPP